MPTLQRHVLRLKKTSKSPVFEASRSELSTVQISLPNRWLRTSLAPGWVGKSIGQKIDSPVLLPGIAGIHRAHNGVPCWRTNSGWWILCVLRETSRAALQNAKAVRYIRSTSKWILCKSFPFASPIIVFSSRKLQEVACCLILLHIASMQDIVSSLSWFLGREFHCHLTTSLAVRSPHELQQLYSLKDHWRKSEQKS